MMVDNKNFDLRYDIRLANIKDIDMIMRFIGENWKKGHIMSVDKKLFEHEFLINGKVNFILAIDRKKKSLEGIFGFIPCSLDKEKLDICGSFWKIKEDDNIPMLGLEMAKRVNLLTSCRMHIGNGANPNTTIPLRRMFFDDITGKMKHYYILNKDVEHFEIAKIAEKKSKNYEKSKEKISIKKADIKDVKNFDFEAISSYPYKDAWYVKRRYFSYPYYKYDVYLILKEEKKALIVLRVQEYNNKKILRIIDYIGKRELFSLLGDFFANEMIKNNYEYTDFYEYGFEDEYIEKAGFILLEEGDKNIIPNYFEPFVQENIDIFVHHKYPNTLLFKGDGDQDRPNSPR